MLLWPFAQEPPGAPASGAGASTPTDAEVLTDETQSEDVGAEVTRVLMNLLPWGISILLHVGVIMLSIFVVWTTVGRAGDTEEAVIPITSLSERPEFKLNTKLPPVETTRVGRGVTASSGFAGLVKPPPGMVVDVSPGGSGQGQGWGPGKGPGVGWGKAKGGGSGLIGIGGGAGGGGGSGSGTPYGLRTGGGTPGGLFGLKNRDQARRIVYVIDASGSLIDTLPFVLEELRRSINGLTPAQQFDVFFFQNDRVIEVPPPGWKAGTPELRDKVNAWCNPKAGNIAPQGITNPVKAIREALRMNPQVVYLLSDNITGRGQYELSQATLLDEIKRANTANAKFNTIQFLYPDLLTAFGMEPTMKLIAQQTGGVYKFVDASELGLR